jgi:hypothetical protein
MLETVDVGRQDLDLYEGSLGAEARSRGRGPTAQTRINCDSSLLKFELFEAAQCLR